MKRMLLGILVTVAALGACADALEDGFREVPVADRPWCYWWWINGHADKETITRDMEAMRRVGFGGLLMFDARGYFDDEKHVVLPKPEIAFMSPEWRELLAFGIKEAARVGLQVSVNLSSCAGALKGPWEVGADAPKRLLCETRPLAGGTRFDTVLKKPDCSHFRDIAAFAVKYGGPAYAHKGGWVHVGDGQQNTGSLLAGEVVELTAQVDAGGHLVWDVPQGQWALVRFGYTTMAGHEYDVDVLDPTAVKGHFDRMGKAIIGDVGPLAGKTLTHFYSVSWEGAVPTWTGAFEKEFLKYRGYDIRPWLPVLAGFMIKDENVSNGFVADYRRTRNDAFRDNFYGTMMALSHRHGLKWHSESGGPWNRSPAIFGEADQLAFLAQNDMPQGEFWYPGGKKGLHMNRPAATAAHIYGKRLAAVESFTHMTRHWTPYPALLKRCGDEAFCDGVNQLVWHTFTCSPKAFGLPGIEYFAGTHINPNVTWHNQAGPFITYLGRCQHLLRQGLFVADVCAYVGDVPYQHWGQPETNWGPTATMTLPKGHGYDLVNTDVLLNRLTAKGGALVLPDGMNYRVLAVDLENGELPLAALRKIEAIKKAGIPVVFGTRKPQRVPGLAAAGDEEVQRLGQTLWTGTPTLAEALKEKGLVPDFEGPFDYTHRRVGESEIYFVAGTGKADCTFRVSGKQPELWDAVSGKTDAQIGWQATGDGRTRLTLDLPKSGSMFVVFRKDNVQRSTPISNLQSEISNLPGPWEVTFQAGRGAPEKVVFNTLIDWTKHADNGIRYFSGTATYRKTFEVTAEHAARKARLLLGTVTALAEVRLNGKTLGIVWTAPWQVELTGVLKPGKNELEIEVTNTWANRLVGDAALPPEQRITKSNMAFQKGKRTLSNFQGFASGDTLQPSGLQGPVQIEWHP